MGSALSQAAVSERIGFKDPQFKVERKGKTSGDSLDPKKIEVQKDTLSLKLEGEWSPPNGDTGSEDPHLTLWARVNVRFPADYKLISLEGPKGEEPVVTEKGDLKESTLVIPFEHFPESSGSFKLIGSDGESTSYTLKITVQAKDQAFFNSPDCDDLGLGVEASNDSARNYRGPVLLYCQAKFGEDGKKTVQVAIEPLFAGSWDDTPTGASPIQGGKRLYFSAYDESKGATFSFKAREKQNDTDKPLEFKMGKGGISPGGRVWFGLAYLGPVAGLQPGTGGLSVSPYVGWRPTYSFKTKPFLIRGLVGFTAFNSAEDGGGLIPTVDVQVLFAYSGVRKLVLEAGGGMQAWFGAAGFNPIFSFRVARLLNRKFLAFIDRIEGGYSFYLFPTFPAHEFGLGVGFAF